MPECQCRHSGVSVVNFERISHFFSTVSIVEFEQVNVSWIGTCPKTKIHLQ